MPENKDVALSPVFAKQIASLKKTVIALAASYGVVREKARDIAPRLMKLYDQIKADNGMSFVSFARQFDATVPTHAKDVDSTVGYRNHKVYYTLEYMRRLVNSQNNPRGQQGVRETATDALARTIATVLQVVKDQEGLYKVIEKEFKYGPGVMTRLKRRVAETKPLFELHVKPMNMGNVIHMEPTVKATAPVAVAGNEFAVAGRRVRRAG